jgi:hypothetical protein
VISGSARPAFIVGFWALAAASFASSGYMAMRTLAQINDCMAEHNVEMISKVGTISIWMPGGGGGGSGGGGGGGWI